jgi:hypothetical protein
MPLLPTWRFIMRNALVWILMATILVIVPDELNRWMPIDVARVLGWAIACGVWVIVVEKEWQARFGPSTRFAFQLILWVSAALVALWISDQVHIEIGS